MLDFVIKYWVQFLFGIIAAALTAFFKRYYDLKEKKLEADRQKRYNDLEKKIIKEIEQEIEKESRESREADLKIEEEIECLSEGLDGLTTGILSMQGREFRAQCRALLQEDHVITIDEYEQFEEDYSAYKGLGGNHKGDSLHDAVVEKFNAQVAKK